MSKSNLKQRKKKLNVGALLVTLGIGAFFLVLIVQYTILMTTQSLNDEDLIAHGEAKYLRVAINEADRGNIVDRNGNVLASDMVTYNAAVITDEAYLDEPLDIDTVSRQLSDIIELDYEEVRETIEYGVENSRFQVEFGTAGRNLTYNEKRALEDANIQGLVLEQDKRRFYPNGDFASNLIGLAEKNSQTNHLVGQMGIEAAFDDYLIGTDGRIDFTQDLWNYVVPNSDTASEAHDGHTVKLTIDSNIQLFLEDSLDEMDEHFEPEAVFATVMDAKTGEILATGQRPSFNPDTREGLDQSWSNVLYQTAFEPGSTFKIFGLAAAIDASEYDPDDTVRTGSFTVGDTVINDWDPDGWGTLSYNEAMQYSSNALMMTLQDRVGTDEMLEYYHDFGFGQTTNSEFLNEAAGIINWQYELDKKSVSFGQSITVTPIQMMQGATAIFNDGMMKKPYVVKSVTDSDSGEVVYEGQETEVRQVISEEAAAETIKELNTMVDGSTNRNRAFMIDDYTVSGKTGTAQIIDEENGGYLFGDYQYLTSFMGYAPVEDPEIVVYYVLRLPTENQSDAWDYGVSLGFTSVTERTLKYLDANEASDTNFVNVDDVRDFTGLNVENLKSEFSHREEKNVIIGDGTEVVDQYPKSGKLYGFEHFFIVTDGTKTMPDLTGVSKRDMYALAEMLNIDLSMNGEGYVSSQSIEAGTVIDEDTTLEVTLQSDYQN